MITENVSTLKIHKLSQSQYNRELEAGNLEVNAIYLTPEENNGCNGEMIYYSNTDNTFEDTLNEILATMKNTSVRHIQFYDKLGLIDNKFLGTLWRYTGNYGVLEAVNYRGLKAIKSYYNGVWQPWEWVNPPMQDGVEYRTVERCGNIDKPTYVQSGTITGNIPDKNTLAFTVAQSGDIVDKLVSVQIFAKYSDGYDYPLPYHSVDPEKDNKLRATWAKTGNRTFSIYAINGDLNNYTFSYCIKYTKK